MIYILVLLICALGGFAAGMTSFGYAIICMLLMPLFISVKSATLVTLMTSFTLYFVILYQSLYKERIRINPRMIIIPILGSIAGRYLGAVLFHKLSSEILMITLCMFMVILNIYFFVISEKIKVRATTVNGLSAGFISGFFGSLNNVGGPPLVAYMYTVEKNRIKYTTYLQIIFLMGGLTSLFFHLDAGNVNIVILKYSVTGVVGVIIGTYIGYYFFNKLDQERLTKLIKYFILVSSIGLIVKTIVDYTLLI